ncbi:MAG: cob(I)yrinic acid a,c-diamide adenosyltransferase [Candidatus Nanohaloarchaeota archaeon QJJ-7]|nr:cob(I)yrinic acid a,c-diamide adenosyltransferase [Candidatus Nanohaloarchaeota archaeon QJJ-7]
MSIYTGRGDQGRTDLWGSDKRLSKASHRIEGYGSADELIGLLGHAAAHADPEIQEDLEHVQNHLHVLMAQLADVEGKGDKEVSQEHVEWLEEKIDNYEEELPEIDGFIIPGGSEAGSILHYSRSVCRRVERRIVKLDEEEGVDSDLSTYINRLSDLLFVLSRYQNEIDGMEEEKVSYR